MAEMYINGIPFGQARATCDVCEERVPVENGRMFYLPDETGYAQGEAIAWVCNACDNPR